MQRLRNLGVPESRVRDVRDRARTRVRSIWPSPASGDVIEKRIINGQQVKAGDELYRIADHSHVWVIADVAESDLAFIKIGIARRSPCAPTCGQPIEGEVTFIYPEMKAETRTARVRIEVPNPDGRLKVDMYADVVFQTGVDETPVIAVPTSALIDSGNRQVVLVAKGEGRFEPRPVKLGRRGDGYAEILEGVNEGEEVVTSATFLIDAESNLQGPRCRPSHSRRPRNDRGPHPLVGAQHLSVRSLASSSTSPASTRSRACRSMPFPISPMRRSSSIPNIPARRRRWSRTRSPIR